MVCEKQGSEEEEKEESWFRCKEERREARRRQERSRNGNMRGEKWKNMGRTEIDDGKENIRKEKTYEGLQREAQRRKGDKREGKRCTEVKREEKREM